MKSIYGDPELIRWLNKEIKLQPAILDIEKQFQNWFYFQEVLYKTGNPLKKILTNKFDEYSTQKNIKIVKKHIIKLVGIEPKVEKGQSQIEEYLKAIKQHSKPIAVNSLLTIARKETKDVLNELTKTMKVTDKKQVQSLVNNYEQKFINSLPKKLKSIEESLHRFRDEKLIHEIQAVQLKQKDEEKERQWLQSLRENELEKIRANHEFIKEQDKKIYEFWKYTESIKHNRIEKEIKLNQMMTGRLVAEVNQKKKDDQKAMDNNIYLFLQTCIRQGIEIEKDPSKKPVPEKAKFSAVATMMKIRERTHKTEEARKARQKRRNKMLVEQLKQQELVEAKKRLDELVDKFSEYGKIANQEAALRQKEKLRGKLQFNERILMCEVLEEQKEMFFEQLRKEAKAREQEVRLQRQKEWRILQVQYMEQNFNRKVQKRLKHIQQMQPLILTILDLADKCYLKMNENIEENGKPLTLDKKIWNKFIEEWQNELSQVKPLNDNIPAAITQDFVEYYHAIKDWKSTQNDNQLMANISLAEFLFEITDELYPMQPLKEGINYYLPLKISLIGGKFSGRKTTAKYLNLKYGLEIIDIESIIKESLKLAFPPVEDPKKKKDTKKVIEIPIVENPELKEYGLQINEYKDTVIPDELLLKGILIKLNQTFNQRTPLQVAQEMKEAKEMQLKKDQQPVVVEEVKKTSKKPGKKDALQSTGPTQEDLIKEYINSKQFYYTKGMVLIGFPENANQAKMLEEQLTGFIPYEERLNQIAEEKKKKFQELLDIPTQEESNKIQQSGIDLIINLDTPFEQRVQRMQNRRIDPLTEIIYNLEENPPPPEIKLDKLLKIENETEEKLQKEFQQFNDNLPGLIEWCEQFGFEEEFKQLHNIKITGKGFEVAKSIDGLINKVLTHNCEYLNQIAEEVLVNETQQEQQSQQQQGQENVDLEKVEEQNPEQQAQILQEKQSHLDAKQSTERGRSQLASRQKDVQSEFLNQDQLKGILKQWDEISNTYIRETTIYIRRMSHQRKKCQQIFLQTQKTFIEFFESPDNKLKLMHEFQQSYNKFLQENDDLSKQKNAKQQLKEHLQKTYEQLWDILNQKKNQALDFVKKLKKDRFVAIQIQQFMQHVLMLLQTETNLLTEIQLLGKPWSEHFILEPPQSQLIDGYKFPQLDVLISYYNDCLDKITQGEESLIIKIQKEIAYKRGQIIRSVAYSKMTEMLLMEDILYSRIDDWIICGIKNENDFCFESINYLKQQIENRQTAILTIPEPSPISEAFKMIYMQQHLIPESEKWRQAIQFYEEVKSLSDSVWIPLDIFESFQKRRTKFLSQFKLNINKIAHLGCYPNVRFSYQTLLITFILYECRVPTQEEIQQLVDDLQSVEPDDQRDYWIEYQFWFDDNFVDQEFNLKIYIKNFLFNVLQSQDLAVSVKENFGYFKQFENQLFSSIFDEVVNEEIKNSNSK
ncbi:unnamed protein product [Paramecium primaurelia]|uniref:Calponin-homology (CH) domain-containing protein n=1 Tax=Paramecium primaurelia TaxID=5886 RepID=A0A8S1L2C4_PARPR|nr:unnamed protein product [Paramecium primaurelia]